MAEARRSEVAAAFLARHYRPGLAAILVLGAALRVAVHLDLRACDPVFDQPPLDSASFLEWAREIATGNLLGDRVFFLNPLYAYFLAPLSLAFGPEPLLAIRIVQMLMGLGTALLGAEAARRLLSPGAGLGTGALLAAWPLLLFYEQTVMIVALAVFLNALTFFALARLREGPTLGRAFLAGLPLGLSVLARPNAALFGVLLPLWILTLPPAGSRLRSALSRTAVLAGGALLMVLPVTLRNLAVGGDLVLVTSSGGVNLYVSNNPEARKTRRMISVELRSNPKLIETDAILEAERTEGRKLRPSEVSAFWTKETLAAAREAPGETAAFLGAKLLMFLGGREIPANYHFETQRGETRILRLVPLSWGWVSPLMLLGLLAALVRRREALPAALLYLAYAVGLALFFPLANYRAPVLPGALALAALGIAAIAVPLLDGRWPAAVGRAGFVLGVAALLLLAARASAPPGPGGEAEGKAILLYNRGMALLGQDRPAEAEAAFREALDLDGSSWLPHLGLSCVARRRGDLAGEQRQLERALALRPEDPATLAHLALNLYDQGLRGQGIGLGRRLVAERPNDGTALGLLAQMLEREGRGEEAFALYRRAEESGLPRIGIIADECHCLRGMGQFARAAANADRGLRLDPRSPDLRFELALAMIGLGESPERISAEIRAGIAAGGDPPPELLDWMRTFYR